MQREGAFPPAAAQTSVVTDLPDHARAVDLDEGPSPAASRQRRPLLRTHVEEFSRLGRGMSGSYRRQNQLRHCRAADPS